MVFGIMIVIIIITSSVSFTLVQLFQNNMAPMVTGHADITCGKAPLTIKFTCKSNDPDGAIKKVVWDFGDGQESTDKIVNHTYQWRGRFDATIKVWDNQGASSSDTIEINVLNYHKPVAIIDADKTCGTAPLKVKFIGDGYDVDGYITNYHWDFGDGSKSEKQYPTHWYNETGTYYVWLTITDSDGEEATTTLAINVIENHVPQAKASANIYSDDAPLTVSFSGDFIDPDSEKHTFYWFFENTLIAQNSWSSEQHPTHTFWFPGVYEVSFTVTDDTGESDTQNLVICVHESFFSKSFLLFEERFIQNLINEMVPEVKNILYRFMAKYIVQFLNNILF
jgi:PKD repeat protein